MAKSYRGGLANYKNNCYYKLYFRKTNGHPFILPFFIFKLFLHTIFNFYRSDARELTDSRV